MQRVVPQPLVQYNQIFVTVPPRMFHLEFERLGGLGGGRRAVCGEVVLIQKSVFVTMQLDDLLDSTEFRQVLKEILYKLQKEGGGGGAHVEKERAFIDR